MILLKLISWQYARKHLLRSVLTTAGIVLGVAVLVGMHTANQSVLQAFNRTVDRLAGRTQLQVSSGESGLPEDVLERVQAVREVGAAAPVVEAVAQTGLAGQGSLLILGVDMTGDRSLRDYDFESGAEDILDDPLVFLAQPDSIIVTADFAARNGLAVNSRLPLLTLEGARRFVVRGILKPGGTAAAFGGNIAIMDIYAAQKMFGKGPRFDRIDIGVRPGVTVAAAQGALRAALGPGFEVDPPEARGAQFESLMGAYSLGVNMSSAFALFIGMFIIYNSFAIAVTQRRGEIGILRALGATRGQIRALFLGESALAGLFGSAVGVLFGLAISRSLTANTGALVQQVYGVSQPAAGIVVEPWLLAGAMALGVITSMLAALVPANQAARVDPVQALQKGRYQVLTAGQNRVRLAAAALTGAGALGCLLLARSAGPFYAGYGLMLAAALLLTPSLALWLARVLRVPMCRLRPVEGALAADSLIQAPRRTSATVAALMFSVAIVIGLAGVARASYVSIAGWIDSALNPDLFVATSGSLAAHNFHFPAAMYEGLVQVPGVAEVQRVRSVRVAWRNLPVLLVAVDMAKLRGRSRWQHVTADSGGQMQRLAEEGRGFIVSENLAELYGLKEGERFRLPSPSGVVDLPIAGIVRDYSSQTGTVFIDRAAFVRFWKDDTVDIFRVYLQPGAEGGAVKRRILERFAATRRLFVLMNAEVKRDLLDITNQWFGLTYVQVAVAILVAVLGIINTLTVSIADRRRELGVLRAVGGLRGQIRGTIWMEALAIGAIGLALGFALGAVSLRYQLDMVRRFFVGYPLDYLFPVSVAALLAPVILGAAFVAALGPAESAVRGSLVEALEYE